MDSIASGGISFTESHCTYPVCSPARSSFFTGRMPHETGVRNNGPAIVSGMSTMGEHFRAHGYRTFHAGKWNLPRTFDGMSGFDNLAGGDRMGSQMDEPMASACVKLLTSKPAHPFLLEASFVNPHDVCGWIRAHPGRRSYTGTEDFPPPPMNMAVNSDEPEYMQVHRTGKFDVMSQAAKIASEWRRDDFRHYVHDYYPLMETRIARSVVCSLLCAALACMRTR